MPAPGIPGVRISSYEFVQAAGIDQGSTADLDEAKPPGLLQPPQRCNREVNRIGRVLEGIADAFTGDFWERDHASRRMPDSSGRDVLH